MVELAQRIGMPIETVREAWRALPDRRLEEARRRAAATGGRPATPSPAPKMPVDPKVLASYRAAAGAALLDPGLVPRIRPWVDRCPSEGLRAVLRTLLELFEDEDAELHPGVVMTALGSHPVRDHVLGLVEFARASDFPPHRLLDESLAFLVVRDRQDEQRRLQARIAELGSAADGDDPAARDELEDCMRRLNALVRSAGRKNENEVSEGARSA